MNTNTNNRSNKLIALVALFCATAAIILIVLLMVNSNNKINALEAKINNGTLTSADVTATAEAEGMTREQVLEIVAEYISDNKLDYSKFVTRDEVASMIANAIAAYDRTRFDENGHCLCCEGGNHVATQTIDNTKTEYIDRTQTIDNTKTEVIDRTVTNYVENPADFSGYYTREEVDALIREALASQVNSTIPNTDPEDQNTVVNFIEADPGFQGQVGNEGNNFTNPGAGEQGTASSENPGFVEAGEGFEGNGNNEGTGDANAEAPIGTGEVIDLRTGSANTDNGTDNAFSAPAEGEQGNGTANTETGFIAAGDGFEGTTDGNVGGTFNAPAEGEQGNGTASSDNIGFVEPDAGFEGNGTANDEDDGDANNDAPVGQVIDLRTGSANTETPVEVAEPEVGFSGVQTTESVDDGFVMPGEGVGFGG